MASIGVVTTQGHPRTGMVVGSRNKHDNNMDNHMQGIKVTMMVTDSVKVPDDKEAEVKGTHDGYGGDKGWTTTTTGGAVDPDLDPTYDLNTDPDTYPDSGPEKGKWEKMKTLKKRLEGKLRVRMEEDNKTEGRGDEATWKDPGGIAQGGYKKGKIDLGKGTAIKKDPGEGMMNEWVRFKETTIKFEESMGWDPGAAAA